MTIFQPLIVCDTDADSVNNANNKFAVVDEPYDLFGFHNHEILESLTFHLLKHPKALSVHLQRIYFCYQQNLQEELFAALVDFLITLEGKGEELSVRLVKGAKAKLATQHYQFLVNALKMPKDDVKWLTGNSYCVFSRGLIGTPTLVIKDSTVETQHHDPLEIARDYVAYSQLDEAMDLLEEAIVQDFERQALHDDLLELYKVTQNTQRFTRMYTVVLINTSVIPAGWEELQEAFNVG